MRTRSLRSPALLSTTIHADFNLLQLSSPEIHGSPIPNLDLKFLIFLNDPAKLLNTPRRVDTTSADMTTLCRARFNRPLYMGVIRFLPHRVHSLSQDPRVFALSGERGFAEGVNCTPSGGLGSTSKNPRILPVGANMGLTTRKRSPSTFRCEGS
jgi:hypothetical protein